MDQPTIVPQRAQFAEHAFDRAVGGGRVNAGGEPRDAVVRRHVARVVPKRGLVRIDPA